MKTRSSIFWRLYLAVGLLLVVTLGGLGTVGAARLEQIHFVSAKDRLVTEATVLDDIARTEKPEEFRDHLDALSRQYGARITLIAEDGTVIADTDQTDTTSLENHSTRPEIVDAKSQSFGSATRQSATLNQRMMYVARRVGDPKSFAAFVRVSVPMESIEREASNLRLLVWSIVGMTCVLSLLLVWGIVRPHAQRLNELENAANAIADGHFDHKVYVDGDDGIGRVAQAFNLMSSHLEEQVAKFNQDRQNLLGVLASMVEGVVAIDADFNVILANERAADLLGIGTAEVTGKKLWQIIRQRPVLDIAKQTVVDDVGQIRAIDRLTHGERTLAIRATALSGAGGPGAVLVFHDVTELARLEHLRKEFVANASHELKTPLSVVLSCAETLQAGAIDDLENRDRFLNSIATQSLRLSTLIADMLALARAESDVQPFPLQEVDVGLIVDECVARHRSSARAKQLELIVDPAPDVDAASITAMGNEGALDEVLDRLLTNAIEYTPANGQITVAMSAQDGKCTVEVGDSGIGIPAADLSRVFERFYRVNKGRSRESGGAGLGLSIVKHLVQNMRGVIRAASEPGKGSTFTVVLSQT